MSKLINFPFLHVLFPESPKLVRVTPVYKKEDPKIRSNYRPISILSIQNCLYSRLYLFLLKFEIFNRQIGFTNSYSTIHALINLDDLIKKYLDNDFYVCGVFIDLQKAFDTVNHDVLLEKLEYYGIR